VNGLKDRTLPDSITRSVVAAGAEPSSDLLKRVACLNLRVAPGIHMRRCGSARFGTLRFEPLEPRSVDRLEWQLRLKPLLGRGVQVARGPERAVAIEVCPIALKAEQSWSGRPSSLPTWVNALSLQGKLL
jgi:hypothetical protein